MKRLLRRLAASLLQLLGVSVLAFSLMELAPGDFLDELRVSPDVPAATIAQWRELYGLDQPPVIRYGRWLGSVVQGEFGLSLSYGVPVADLLSGRVIRTVQLSLSALLLAWGLGVPLGVWVAGHRNHPAARLIDLGTSAVLALPEVLIALGVLALAAFGHLPPVSGKLMPAAAVLALVTLPAVFRHTRSSVARALQEPFVDHARACGLPESRILWHHALRAALHPLVPLAGLSLAGITSSSLVVEVVLSWPGLGPLLLESILARDAAVVLATVSLTACLLVTANLVTDLLLLAADPRIRPALPAGQATQ